MPDTSQMAVGRCWAVAAAVASAMVGCRLPGMEGPASRALVASRQLSQQGVAALDRGQFDRAEELLAEAVRTCPSNPDARRNYAEARWQRGFRREALAELEFARRHAPDDASLLVRIAEMRLALGHTAAALQAAEQAIDLDPKLASAWAVRSGIFRAERNLTQALADAQRALRCAPEDRRIPCEIAALYLDLNQPQQALAAIQGLGDRYSPGDEPQEVLYWQGVSYLALARYEDAAESLSAAAARGRPTAEILFRLAQAYWGAGRPGEALAAAKQAVGTDPKHRPALDFLQQAQLARLPAGTQPR